MPSTSVFTTTSKNMFISYCRRRMFHQLLRRDKNGNKQMQKTSAASLHVDPPEDTPAASETGDRSHHGDTSADTTVRDRSHHGNTPAATETEDRGRHGRHVPVMAEQVMQHLNPQNHKLYVDMTFGGGGHTRSILALAPEARVVCVDRDPTAISVAQQLASKYRPGQIVPCHSRFSQTHMCLLGLGVAPGTVDGVLFDVGASSMQFDEGQRGFALSVNGPLDMRMDQSRDNMEPTAADVVNCFTVQELALIIKKYGGDRRAMNIAHAVVEARSAFGSITHTQQLADIIASAFPESVQHSKRDKLNRPTHVATQTFMALRIFVNNELNELNNGLEVAHYFMRPGGRCVTLTFHSLEDRIAKRHFHDIDIDAKPCMSLRELKYQFASPEEIDEILQKRWTPVSKRVILPTESECVGNPRARSAKLRAAVRCA